MVICTYQQCCGEECLISEYKQECMVNLYYINNVVVRNASNLYL